MATFNVGADGDDALGNGSAASPWRTVAHAAAQVPSGSMLAVGPGEYSGALVVDRDLTIIGAGRTASILRCVETSDPYQPALRVIGARKLRLEGLRLDGQYVPFGYTPNGIFAEDGGVELQIEQCAVEGFLNYYLRVIDGHLALSNSRIGVEPALYNDVGVQLVDSTAVITNATIGNQIDHCIDMRGASHAEITHCTLNGSNLSNNHGIRLMDQSSAEIGYNAIVGKGSNNVAFDQGSQAGIILFDTALAAIHHNEISAFAVGIRFLTRSSCRLWSNGIHDNFDWGIECNPQATATALQPDLGGGRQGSPGANKIERNGVAGGNDVKLQGSGTLFARFNHWSSTDPALVLQKASVGIAGPYGLPLIDVLPLAAIPAPAPMDAVLLLDSSGSMLQEGKWDAALAGIERITSMAGEVACDPGAVRLGLVTFAATGPMFATRLQQLGALATSAAPMATLRRPLSPLPLEQGEMTIGLGPPMPSWATPLGEGLLAAREALGALQDGRRKLVFLLSDGKHNSGVHPDIVYPGFAGTIAVHALGYGDDAIDPELLSEIALATLGDYVLTGSTDPLQLHSYLLGALANALEVQVIASTTDVGVNSFPVNDGEAKLLIHVGWADPAVRLQFDLLDPAGTIRTPADPGTGAVFRAPTQLAAVGYVIDNPAAGDWKVLNLRRSGGGNVPPTVRFAAVDARVVAQCWVDRSLKRVGVPFRLGARVLEDGIAIERIEAQIEVTRPASGVGELVAKHCESFPDEVRRLLTQKELLREDRRRTVLRAVAGRADLLPSRSEKLRLSKVESTPLRGKVPKEPVTSVYEVEYTPAVEGTHTFRFLISGRTRAGFPIQRSFTTSAYVRFLADASRSDAEIKLAGTWRKSHQRYRVTITPRTATGERMGPFRADRLHFELDYGAFIGEVTEERPGTYSRDFIKAAGEEPKELGVAIDGISIGIAVSASQVK